MFKPNYVRITHDKFDSDDEALDVEGSSREHFSFEKISDVSNVDSQNANDEHMNEVLDTEGGDDSFNESYQDKCLKELESDHFDIIVRKLYDTKQLHDFMCLFFFLKG